MPVPDRPKSLSLLPGLQWLTTDDGSRTLWDERLDETYHSGCGAVAESLIVYLVNSGVHERLKSGQPTNVLEYGFGTGTAFFLTAAAALLHGTPLRYRALELTLLPAELLRSLELGQCKLAESHCHECADVVSTACELLEEFIHWRDEFPNDAARGVCSRSVRELVELELVLGNAMDYQVDPQCKFDAVYFDPFSPSSCPELWTQPVFQTAFDSLANQGILAT